MSLRSVSSASNPSLKRALALAKSSRERKQSGLTVISGVHLVQAFAQHAGLAVETLVNEEAQHNPEIVMLLRQLPSAIAVKASLFTELSGLMQGGDIAQVVATPKHALPARLDQDCLVLDQVQDPGNLGSILRTAAAAGVQWVIPTAGSVFAWSPKVLRAGMGAHFALQICEGLEWAQIQERLALPVYATSLEGASALFDADLRAPCCWVFGNEGAGVGPEILQHANRRLYIDQSRGVESLNVAASAAVCLFEQRRQRSSASAARQ
jgi:RNA methyltransferase, TrmH family